MRRTGQLSVAACALAMMWGCDDGEVTPRKPAFPVFDARQVFPELGASDAAAPAARANDSVDVYEEALQRELRQGGAPDSVISPQAQSVQVVPMGGVLIADLPVTFNEWRWATDGGVTLITHSPPGGTPDAMIYVEAFSQAVEQFPSYEVGRFQFTVDPGLSPNIVYPPLVSAITRIVRKGQVPPMQTALSLQLATTRTMGLGLGYSSTPDTFTGWRWVGTNSHDVKLRMGRSMGSWGSALGGAMASASLERAMSQLPGLEQLAGPLRELAQTASSQRRAPTPSWMLIGSATQRDTLGVHMAVICVQRPVCPVSESLAKVLATLRPMDGTEQLASPTAPQLVGFAASLGVGVLPAEQAISAPQMIVMLERAAASSRPGLPGLPNLPGMPNLPGLPQPGATPGVPIPIPGSPGGALPNPAELLPSIPR